MKIHHFYMATFFGMLTAASLVAEEKVPQKIDLSEVPAVVLDEVIIPIPHEIFLSMDKLGVQDWKDEVRQPGVKIVGKRRAETALLFGLVIANGFVAVEAEDAKMVQNVGRDVLRVAEALGVEGSVTSHTQSIQDGANSGEWDAVRRELDLALGSVRTTMEAARDNDIADLVSLGGWLGGTEVLASLLTKTYKPEGAELLNQSDLAIQLWDRYSALPENLRKGEMMGELGQTLKSLTPLLKGDGEGGEVNETNVKEIAKVAGALVARAYQTGGNK